MNHIQVKYLSLALIFGLGGFLIGKFVTEPQTMPETGIQLEASVSNENHTVLMPVPVSGNKLKADSDSSPAIEQAASEDTTQPEQGANLVALSTRPTQPTQEYFESVNQHQKKISEELATSLRAAGAPEADIQAMIDSLAPQTQLPATTAEDNPDALPPSKDEQESELRASLTSNGANPADIDTAVKAIFGNDDDNSTLNQETPPVMPIPNVPETQR